MSAWCTECKDEFDPVEYAPVSLDPDEPRFCSWECQEEYDEQVEFEQIYNEGRYGAASVF